MQSVSDRSMNNITVLLRADSSTPSVCWGTACGALWEFAGGTPRQLDNRLKAARSRDETQLAKVIFDDDDDER